jgi:ribosome-interacting GTPase 1
MLEELRNQRIFVGSAEADEETDYTVYPKPALLVGNKADLPGAARNLAELREFYGEALPAVGVSAGTGAGLEELRTAIFRMLDIIRVYTKTPGRKPDMNDPIVLPAGSTLEEAATEVHKDFPAKLKFARIWGSGKHDGVMVKRDHVLQDGDIIELHM